MDLLARLNQGKLIVFPTDTLYGLAAKLDSQLGVETLFQFKRRAKSNPMVVQTASIEEIESLVSSFPKESLKLAKKYWPGPLTLVLPVDTERVPSIVRADLKTCGFRIPNHPFALDLLKKAGPLVVTSVNKSGAPPCLTKEEIFSEIADQDILFLDGLPLPKGEASTVVHCTDDACHVLRQGSLDLSLFR